MIDEHLGRRAALRIGLALLLCLVAPASRAAEETDRAILVAGAASLQPVLKRIGRAFQHKAKVEVTVTLDPQTGMARVFAEKQVVDEVFDDRFEIEQSIAQRYKSDVELGETIMVESTPNDFGRIAAQTAKQVILQGIKEVERAHIYGEYMEREGELITATVQRLAKGNAAYEERFDRVFLIRAAGRDTEDILAELDRRLQNDEATERAETVDNLRQIALLRLEAAL